LKDLTKDDILCSIERSGVFGMGGGAFPTAEKIKAVQNAQGERHLIVNGAECDPGLLHDKWLLRRHAAEILKGIRLLSVCVPFASVTVAVKDAEGLNFPKDMVYKVPDIYPAGAEKFLIREILHKDLPYGAVPAREGILVLNVQTVFAVYEAVCLNRKADTRLLTAARVGQMSGRVARVPLGMKITDAAEKLFPGSLCVFAGGGMMSAHMAADEDVLGKSDNFLAVGGFPRYKESPLCMKCGLCGAVCPARLSVREIAEFVDGGQIEKTKKLHPERCLGCGSCSMVCLAGRNLMARTTAAKRHIQNKT
jgi:Na+-translocating ferredoxin:NAD+ oxidoreductase RnfC subunit